MIRLRPHHLLCMLTYVGKGYTERFTANMTAVMQRINKGERDILLIEGPDDLCAPRLNDPDDPDCHCHQEKMTRRDEAAMADLGVTYGDHLTLTLDLISDYRKKFAARETRSACSACQWHDLCTEVAANGFDGAVLQDRRLDSTAHSG